MSKAPGVAIELHRRFQHGVSDPFQRFLIAHDTSSNRSEKQQYARNDTLHLRLNLARLVKRERIFESRINISFSR